MDPNFKANEVPARRGFWLALALSMLFLALTAYSAVGLMLDRLDKTDVNKAAAGGAWSGVIAMQVVQFVAVVVLLHLAFGALAWVLARSSAVLWPRARDRFLLIVTGWFMLMVAVVLSYEAYWYPRTLMGAYYHHLMIGSVGPFHVGPVIYISAVAFGFAVLVAAGVQFLRGAAPSRRRKALAGTAIAVTAVVSAFAADRGFGSSVIAAESASRPNIIVLGIDSLRLNELRRFGASDDTVPNINHFLESADVFTDASTPAARTFSSWVAILTGRSPVETGARCNLTNRKVVEANPTFADVLKSQGYRTVYSTDEVRFANIDQTYGFDQVITPPIGAADFLIGTYNELPLASLVINTPIGRYLFPFSYANRGVAMMFRPETYLGRIDRELRPDGPTLFVAHLTAAHWPYYVSETPFGVMNDPANGDLTLYRTGLRTADAMFGGILDLLHRKGLLRNALVIVLSDHGEAFGLDGDTFYKNGSIVKGLGSPLIMNSLGHGQSVLSPMQYKTLLAFRSLGDVDGYRSGGRDYSLPTTVEDIAPTLLALLGVPADELQSSGISLSPLLRTQGADTGGVAPDRVRFTETDLAVMPSTNGTVDEAATARRNSKFFGIDPHDGRLAIRDDFLPLALAYKERAAFTPGHLLAAIPAGPYAHQYVYFDTRTGGGQLLLERPDAELPEAQRLWDALQAHYDGELRPATRVTYEDWERIEHEWANFFVERQKAQADAGSGATHPSS